MMNRKEFLRSTYRWEVETNLGNVLDENSLKHPSMVEACRISLIPQRQGYRRIDVSIPRGAMALFYFTCVEELGGAIIKMIFRVGYELNQSRFLDSVEVK